MNFPTRNSNFRNDISALRVIAVLAVVLYHYNIAFFSGGFIGVDIFFVISGYLMTKIIISNFDNNNFDLLSFYKKRLHRIAPALLTMIAIFGMLVFYVVPTQFIKYCQSAFSSSIFISNAYYFFNRSYFDALSHQNFLLHTWSLSVEWQFYIAFPLILLLLKRIYKKNKASFLNAFAIITILSFSAMLFHNISHQKFSFYSTYTRAWEMLLGGIAYLTSTNLVYLKRKLKLFFIIISYTTIVIFVIHADPTNWPSSFTLLPVFATSILIALPHDFKIFRNKHLIYIGNISYSIYLYHWPFYVLSLFLGLNLTLFHRISFIAASLLFAMLSYQFIEKRNNLKNTKWIISSTLLLCATCFCLSKVDPNYYFSTEKAKLAQTTAKYHSGLTEQKQYRLHTVHYSGIPKFEKFEKDFLNIKNNKKRTIVLLGDSHAGMFAHTFVEICNDLEIELIQITGSGMFPIRNSGYEYPEVAKYFNYIFNTYLPNNKMDIDLVVVNALYFAFSEEELNHKMSTLINDLKSNNLNYVFLGQTPMYYTDYPTEYYMNKHNNINYESSLTLNNQLEKLDKNLVDLHKSNYLSLLKSEVVKVSDDFEPFMYDRNHLTYFGANQYKAEISKKIKELLKL